MSRKKDFKMLKSIWSSFLKLVKKAVTFKEKDRTKNENRHFPLPNLIVAGSISNILEKIELFKSFIGFNSSNELF